MNITKVVIPAAGFGTRFLPITKSVPKELLPLLNKPALQQIVEEAFASNVPGMVIVVSPHKEQAIKQYFKINPELECALQKSGKQAVIFELQRLIERCSFEYPIQTEAKGLGHAILQAQSAIGNNFFGVMLPDDIIVAPDLPALGQLKAIAQEYRASVIAVQKVPLEAVSSYGIVGIKSQLNERTYELETMVEKPQVDQAPSAFAIVGRYIFDPILFDYLQQSTPGSGGEIQLTDAVAHMMRDGHRIIAYEFQGTRFDLGTPLGWLEANLFFAKESPYFSRIFKKI